MFSPVFVVRTLDEVTLSALLECLTAINLHHIKRHPIVPKLYSSGVRYMAEGKRRSGRPQEYFADIPTVQRLGVGDCEDLACWRAAELRFLGEHAVAIPVKQPARDGRGELWHVVVKRGNGTIEDPSKRLGMKEGG